MHVASSAETEGVACGVCVADGTVRDKLRAIFGRVLICTKTEVVVDKDDYSESRFIVSIPELALQGISGISMKEAMKQIVNRPKLA